jgi:hypothetical protein
MSRFAGFLYLGLLVSTPLARAYEYPLQFTPNPGYRGLIVAGYHFSSDTVIGNCSYRTVRSGSGRGGGYHTFTTYYNQTCTWDPYGNLLSIAQGAPTVPAPLYVKGTQTVYAVSATGATTGSDSAVHFGGFVNTPGSHYTWLTSNAYLVLQQQIYRMPISLVSDGDLPLHVAAVAASALLAKVTIIANTCHGPIAVGATCTITIAYNPIRLSSPTGLAYDSLDISLTTDAGEAFDFIQRFTDIVRIPVDDGDTETRPSSPGL